jgi:hypothetical protein
MFHFARTLTEFLIKEDNLTADIVNQFHYNSRDVCMDASRAATWTSPICLAVIDQELPTWNATSRKLAHSSKMMTQEWQFHKSLLNLKLDTTCR